MSRIGVSGSGGAVGRLRRLIRLVTATCAAVGATAMATPAHAGGTPTLPAGTAVTQMVASGPARSLGEPAAAQDSAVTAVVATGFGSAGAVVRAWTRPATSRWWAPAGPVLPSGFGSSYDASAAAQPGGPLLVVVGASPAGQPCIANGSVALADVYSSGRLGPARLVSDQRGTGRFDDRPVVAVGAHGTVWVAWSEGPDSDACQDVGVGDRVEVAVSHDGGRTFGVPVAMPTDGGNSAFGARLAPLSPGRVAVSWTESTGLGDEAVLVSVLGPGDQVTAPQQVLTGDALPLVLPGASFYDFPAGDIAAFPGGVLVVAAPLWRSGRGVINLAAGVPGGSWRVLTVDPPSGADLLLPALGTQPPTGVLLVCAVHMRAGDRLGYDSADFRLGGDGLAVARAGLAPLTPSPIGPGYFELGEELSITASPGGLLFAAVVAGRDGAVLQTESWAVPRPVTPGSPSERPAPERSRTQAGVRRQEGAARPGRAWAWPAGAAAVILACAGLLAAVRATRWRGTRASARPRPRRRAGPG